MLLASLALGCGGDPATGSDASSEDGGSTLDASGGDGSVTDASTDADGDGIPAGRDCDDVDSAVGATAERACASACGAGLERCTDGVWAACDAPTDCTCTMPGMTRLASCERCGMRSERCSDAGVWEPASECLDQGECEVAAVETRATAACGTEQRLCGATCTWGAWSAATPDGECTPGDSFPCDDNFLQFWRCQDDCRWDTSECL